MMNVFKYLFLAILLSLHLMAQKACIITFTTKVIFSNDKNVFLKRFPAGIIEKNDKFYTFKLRPFDNYKQASKALPKVQQYYHDAFIVNCNPRKKNKCFCNKNIN